MDMNDTSNPGSKVTNVLMVVAVVAVLVAAFNVYNTMNLASTGHATDDEGYALVEIEAVVSIIFTTDTLDWGAGAVDAAADYATLDSNAGTVTDGSWVAETDSLILVNDGSVNAVVTLDSGTVDADEFICSDDVSGSCQGTGYAEMNYMVSENEASSCGGTGVYPVTYGAIPLAASEETICPDFESDDSSDELALDVQLVIPKAAPPTSGSSTLTLYLEATSV